MEKMSKKIKMNPVLRKELRVSVRSFKFALLVTFYNAALAVVALFMFFACFDAYYHGYLDYTNILNIFLAVALIEYSLTLFIVPVQTASSIAGEREKQTLEILLTTTLKPMQIVVGKVESSLSTILLLVVSSLPIVFIVFSIGGITVGTVIGTVVLIFSGAICAGSIGVWSSARFKKTIPAIVSTFSIMFIIGAGTVILLLAIEFMMSMYQQSLNNFNYTPDIGYGVLLLLTNPVITVISFFTRQFGNAEYLMEIVVDVFNGEAPDFVIKHWFEVSLLVQYALAALFLLGASKRLDPLRKRRMKRKEKKEWKQLQEEMEKERAYGREKANQQIS